MKVHTVTHQHKMMLYLTRNIKSTRLIHNKRSIMTFNQKLLFLYIIRHNAAHIVHIWHHNNRGKLNVQTTGCGCYLTPESRGRHWSNWSWIVVSFKQNAIVWMINSNKKGVGHSWWHKRWMSRVLLFGKRKKNACAWMTYRDRVETHMLLQYNYIFNKIKMQYI